jgi:5-methylcytosine-specific restriction endonuclease McrA
MPDRMSELLNRMRRDRPLCRVCGELCDPDTTVDRLVPTVLMVSVDPQGDKQGLIPVHAGCEAEARDRLGQAQAVVNLRRIRTGTEPDWEKARRLIDSGEAAQLD